ncbi:MAG: hypothetical protein NT062_05060 [Proteobacteria bacterium]|nr:hypothetical protein [Pseudomonadota bacterium]
MERLRRALRGIDRAEAPALPVGEALHPVALLAVAILVLNDWVLKPRCGGIVTGKLSDVAGLAFAPVLLSALIGLALHPLRARLDPSLSRRRLVACVVATGVGFTAIKLVPALAGGVAAVIGHGATFSPDWTDLLTLPALAIAYAIGRDELRRVPLGRPAAIHRLARPAAAALRDVPADTTRLAAAIDRWDPVAIDAILGA